MIKMYNYIQVYSANLQLKHYWKLRNKCTSTKWSISIFRQAKTKQADKKEEIHIKTDTHETIILQSASQTQIVARENVGHHVKDFLAVNFKM